MEIAAAYGSSASTTISGPAALHTAAAVRQSFEERWSAKFGLLAAFHSDHGHCRVPRAQWVQQRYPGLHRWLQAQQRQWREGTITDERRRRLEGLGVVFQARDSAWEARFAELLDFREEFGHMDVPFQWARNPGLAAWVMTQRRRWRRGPPLTAFQLSRLQSCGFELAPMDGRWDHRHTQLHMLRLERSGDLLSKPLPADDGLAAWVRFQLNQWKEGRLAPDRAAKLEVLGLAPCLQNQRCRMRKRPQLGRLAALDKLISCLGLPATFALLTAAPAASAATIAAEALSWEAARRQLNPAKPARAPEDFEATSAADLVRWYRALKTDRMPDSLAQALHLRGLPVGRAADGLRGG